MKALLLYFALCCCIVSEVFSQEKKIVFERISNRNGLSHNNVLCMLQDKKGYIWFGTYDGLNRYDGHSFKSYAFNPHDITSLSQHLIMSLYEDEEGIIWVGTAGMGICKFDPSTEKFTRYIANPKIDSSLHNPTVLTINEDNNGILWLGTVEGISLFDKKSEKFIRIAHKPDDPITTNDPIGSIYKDQKGDLWIGTGGKGISKFTIKNKGQKKFHLYSESYQHNPLDSTSLGNNHILAFHEGREGGLWVGTWEGLDYLDKKNGTFIHFIHEPDVLNTLSSNHINANAIAEDLEGNLWIGTSYGLNKVNKERNQITRYYHDPADPGSISSNDIHSIMVDRTGIIWIGTIGGGINKMDPNQRQFRLFQNDPLNSNSLSQNAVRAIHEDKEGILWIGTEGGGLNRFDKSTGIFEHFKHDSKNKKSLSSDYIGAITEDIDGNLWIGNGGSTFYGNDGGGINKFNKATGDFKRYFDDKVPNRARSVADVFSIFEDKEGILWIGTEFGFKSYDRKNKKSIHFPYDPKKVNEISNIWVYTIFEDNRGIFWIGTNRGAYKYNRKTRNFKHFKYEPENLNSLSSNSVKSIHEDKAGNLWFGTSGGGLCLFNPLTETFAVYTEIDGLPDNTIYSILEDDEGNLWLSTNKGISRFSPSSKTFINFDESDGLQGGQFASGYVNTGASFKGKDGTMYFGGQNGFNMFHPDEIFFNKNIPPVVITEMRLFDKPMPGKQEANEIVLTYDQNFLSFEFAALNFTNPHKNKYAYMLENFDTDWVYTKKRRYASYTNLDPGTYIFKVKGANNDGIWNEEGTSLKLIILPPWWATIYAYCLYVILSLSIIYGLIYYARSRERLKNALKLQQIESEKMHEIDHLKSRFFANISHEFRTPLTLILGPIEQLLGQHEGNKDYNTFNLIRRNAQRMLNLINQLLDISKLEAGHIQLDNKEGDVMEFFRALVASFDSLAQSRNIDFNITIPSQPLIILFDADKLEKIIANLLSNAFKFTPDGGSIKVIITVHPHVPELKISVEDTGIGIGEDQVEKIFDRFYQIDNPHTLAREGTGIGLALTKELVDLHHGTIHVQSTEYLGSLFTASLPYTLIKENLSAADTLYPKFKYENSILGGEIKEGTEHATKMQSQHHSNPLILVVEDNKDIRRYICEQLKADYRLIEAVDGEEGLSKALETIPDLIISDVMMPKIDGMVLCSMLKTDERTNHIPIILLTAKASQDSKLEGLQTGADDFLTKPFFALELQLRVKNLIEQRVRLRQSIARESVLQPKAVPVNTIDEKFLQKATTIVEKHMSDPEFNVEVFGKEIGMSRTQLYRKLHALTNQPPSELIKTIRLKRAIVLLQQNHGNIGEIAFAVGFNDPSYFTRCFKETYGKSPSEYFKLLAVSD